VAGAAERVRNFWAGLMRLSALGVVAVNLLPVAGVLMLGWPAGVLLMLYWCENVVIGVINILKMAISGAASGLAGIATCLFIIPFFIVHYGLFCYGHGTFVVMIGHVGQPGPEPRANGIPDLVAIVETLVRNEPGFAWSLAAIVAWRLWGLVADWLLKGGARETNPMAQMFEPYGRIVILHVTLIAGMGLVMALGQPVWALLVLAIIKTLFDLGLSGDMGKFRMTEAQRARTDEGMRALDRWLAERFQTRR